MIPIKLQNLIMDRDGGPSILVLCPITEDGTPPQRFIAIWIGSPEAAQIGLVLEGIALPRPLTHDLFIDALTNLDAYVDHVVLTDVKESTFFATIVLRCHGRLIELDARPSDAIALALRQGAPLYAFDTVMEKGSYPFAVPGADAEESEMEAFKDFVSTLTPDDFS